MKNKKPIKRDKAIQAFSREHHHSLLLSWKIRTGISKGISSARIKRYADWFFAEHIQPHFELEEKYLFPILGTEHKLVKKALAEHRRLTRLFKRKKEIDRSLSLIEEELESHVRFEERVLFNEIQQIATLEELQTAQKMHRDEKFVENTEDEFWK